MVLGILAVFAFLALLGALYHRSRIGAAETEGFQAGFRASETETWLLSASRLAAGGPPPGYYTYRRVADPQDNELDLSERVFAQVADAEFSVTHGNFLETGRPGWYRCIPVEPNAILLGDRRAVHPSIFNRYYVREGA